MQISECFQSGLKELTANKVRSFLSILGIVIGIVALIAMTAIMAGIEIKMLETLDEMGGLRKGTIVSTKPIVDGRERVDLITSLDLEDVLFIKNMPAIQYASGILQAYKTVSINGNKESLKRILGGVRDTLLVEGYELQTGRPLTYADISNSKNVCLIGSIVRNELFGRGQNPVGKSIEIGGQAYKVVGVLKEKKIRAPNKRKAERLNDVIYVPVTTALNKIPGFQKINQISFQLLPTGKVTEVKREILSYFDQKHRGIRDVMIQTAEENFIKSKESSRGLRISATLIAGISLVVGGIGIMNVMIASVAQRVKEIGIRKAVGAKDRDIMIQFIIESVVISTSGGLLGILLSYVVVWVMGFSINEMTPTIQLDAILTAAFFSVAVGILSGIYPALKAAKMDPITALRFQ